MRDGYGILQPRVGVSLPSAGRSWFVRIFTGDTGIDPYTRAVSDVYQDVFGEGSFIGKGIYDVDAFETAIRGRFPDNTVLSHDLLESVHARSALVSDVELYEEYPSRYNADIKRRHRWIRGDWQIAQWLLPRVPGPDARRIANPLSGLSKWKILDNLRRSLIPTALVLLLLASWILLPQWGFAGPLTVVAVVAFTGVLTVLTEALRKPKDWPARLHLRSVLRSLARQCGQIFLTLVFLPYDAYICLDAIMRTLARLLFLRKRLLEWQLASDSEKEARTDLAGFCRAMWIAPALALATGAYLLLAAPEQLFTAAPFIAIWLWAPWIAWRISQPCVSAEPELSAEQLAFLRRTARKTWRFFETFVTGQENWLPPDNFQEHPAPVVASRTSPTNMGLALLANLAASDMGWLPAAELLQRTRDALGTMGRLERHRGHFYNWYDTRDLQPLQPHYVSSVDSGNLAGHLLVLGAGLKEFAGRKIYAPEIFQGLRDTLAILTELAGRNPLLEQTGRTLAPPPENLPAAQALLVRLCVNASKIAAAFANANPETAWWSRAFERGCRGHLDDLNFLAPWLALRTPVIGSAWFNGTEPAAHSGNAAPAETSPVISGSAEWSPGREELRRKLDWLSGNPSLPEIAGLEQSLCRLLEELAVTAPPELRAGLVKELLPALRAASRNAAQRLAQLESLAGQITAMAGMDFNFLYDAGRDLFAIGYNVTERRLDSGFYDLLASEARLGSYVAIAQGQVPQKHWFSLGRLLASSRGEPVLVSWSGSMFEYLMPLLVMPTYENTLLDQTCRAAVAAQIEYGRARGTPWGVSESGFNLTDVRLNYQYRAFGVPGLGFKRGLAEDLVIAPYAAAMALMVAPAQACEDLERLAAEGRTGEYGFFEAVDYTPSRLPPNETSVTIRSFMAHHQGMSLLALDYLIMNRPMQRRFLAHAPFKAEELLLQERVPRTLTTLYSEDLALGESRELKAEGEGIMRVVSTPNTPAPEVHLLSNGRYHVLVTNAGGGYSRWQELAVTRWREDATRDGWGSFCYLRDLQTGEFWSAAYQPTLQLGKHCEAIFTQGRAEFRQRHGLLETHTEISVSPEDDVELRRVTLTNHDNAPINLEVTTYAEVVLASAAADAAHPAFGNLFVQTEFLRPQLAILCTRRARAPGEKPPWLFHLLTTPGGESGPVSFETDRARFIGRGRTPASPAALREASPLSNTEGSVLDPIVALRHTVTIPPQESAHCEVYLGEAESREAILGLVEKYRNQRMADRLFDLAWTHSQVTLRQLDATEANAQLYAKMASALVYANPLRRASPAILRGNRRGQSNLWSYSISGDLPMVLLQIGDGEKIELVRRLVQAHAYWRLKGLAVDLVILTEDSSVYRQSLHERIVSLVASGLEAQMLEKPGGIFVRRHEQVAPEDRLLLQAVARIFLSDEGGTLDEQLQRRPAMEPAVPELKPVRPRSSEQPVVLPPLELAFFNGLGGFTPDGREYIITLHPDGASIPSRKSASRPIFSSWRSEKPNLFPARASAEATPVRGNGYAGVPDWRSETARNGNRPPNSMTPAPWVNVLANPSFGTVVSETGGAYTWFENSHEFRLTPWHNDPVTDVSGEALYLRDDETGEFWSPTPLPARGATPYVVRHGFGYTVFEHTEQGIASEVWVYVAMDAPVKFVVVKLRNVSGRSRRVSVFGCWELVLGDRAANPPSMS